MKIRENNIFNEGRRISIHFSQDMGHGSQEKIFELASLMNLRTSLSVMP